MCSPRLQELENLAEVARLLGKSNQKETMPRILSSIEAHSRHTCYLKSKSHEHAVRKLGATSILRVSLYHPVQTSTKIQEFLVLGSQKLSELKDKIYCITDTIVRGRDEELGGGGGGWSRGNLTGDMLFFCRQSIEMRIRMPHSS